MKIDLTEIKNKTVNVNNYIGNLGNSFRDKFLTRKGAYRLEPEIISQLKQFAKDYIVIAFSAKWCGDCATNIPVLALISEATGLEVRVFGGLKKTR